jgi:exodeoxyribonuclease VII large subunit
MSSVATLEAGQDLHIRVADGRIGATATTVERVDLLPDTEEGEDDE